MLGTSEKGKAMHAIILAVVLLSALVARSEAQTLWATIASAMQ